MSQYVTREQADIGRLFDNRNDKIRQILSCRDMWVLAWGPAGSGKTRAILEKLRSIALKYPRSRILIVRSIRKWLTQSALVTWEEKVLVKGDVLPDRIRRAYRSEYRFVNGSVVVVAGLDDPQQVMSAEYDIIYINEATEVSLDVAETALNRIRNGRVPYQQVIMDCNPAAPTHWLKKAMDAGRLTAIEAKHVDNPALYDADRREWTAFGQHYVQNVLEKMSGIRRTRLRDGLWAIAEGCVYEDWDESIHHIPPRPIPWDWDRYWAIDFGYTNPFVWQWWAEDPDGALHLYREIYLPGVLVEDAVKMGFSAMEGWTDAGADWSLVREPRPQLVVADHDAEDRATFERHAKIETHPADKRVSAGIQDVQGRLKTQPNGRPRIFVHRGCLIHRPAEALQTAGKPTCTAEEFASYSWDSTKPKGEAPLKRDDHGMDAMRYVSRARADSPPLRGGYGTDYEPDVPPDGVFG